MLTVNWVGDGLPEFGDVFFYDEDDGDETNFMQMGAVGDTDFSMLMQLNDEEENLLHQLGVPDQTRRQLRDMLWSLRVHQDMDEGPEYRWGLGLWLRAWSSGCEQMAQVIDCLERRTVAGVPFYPVVRHPRDAAQRVRSMNWNRQWSPILLPLFEFFVEQRMRELSSDVQVQPAAGGSGSHGPSTAMDEDVTSEMPSNGDGVNAATGETQPSSSSSCSTSSRSSSRSPVGVMILPLCSDFNQKKLVSFVKLAFGQKPLQHLGCSLQRWPISRKG